MIDYIVNLNLTGLHWQSDWNGDEVGFDDAEVVGLYSQERDDGKYYFYIDVCTMEILDFWKEPEEQEEIETQKEEEGSCIT